MNMLEMKWGIKRINKTVRNRGNKELVRVIKRNREFKECIIILIIMKLFYRKYRLNFAAITLRIQKNKIEF